MQPPGSRLGNPRTVRTYALLFASAAAIGIAVAYALDLSHPAWAGAAAVFIMRPDPHLLISRAMGRVCATVAGVLLAALLYRRCDWSSLGTRRPSPRARGRTVGFVAGAAPARTPEHRTPNLQAVGVGSFRANAQLWRWRATGY